MCTSSLNKPLTAHPHPTTHHRSPPTTYHKCQTRLHNTPLCIAHTHQPAGTRGTSFQCCCSIVAHSACESAGQWRGQLVGMSDRVQRGRACWWFVPANTRCCYPMHFAAARRSWCPGMHCQAPQHATCGVWGWLGGWGGGGDVYAYVVLYTGRRSIHPPTHPPTKSVPWGWLPDLGACSSSHGAFSRACSCPAIGTQAVVKQTNLHA